MREYFHIEHTNWMSFEKIAENATQKFNKDINFHNVRKEILGLDKLSLKVEAMGIEGNNWKHAWVKDDDTSIFVKNPTFNELSKTLQSTFEDICNKYTYKDIEPLKSTKKAWKNAIQIAIADSHVWMNPTPDENTIFGYKYTGEIYSEKIQSVFPTIVKEYNTHGKFEELILLDLWDREDGLWGQTTRWGHNLPQNMTDSEVFETCIDAKLKLVSSIMKADMADKIIIRDVVNANHSAAFAHCVSIATMKLINAMFWDVVKVEALTRFMEHRTYWEHTFIYTHGKDSKHQFKWLPLHLNDKATNFIQEYIEHYDIDSKYIHVLKWDLHQIGFNKVKKFDYRNFPSFAPWSAWVSHNFWDTYSGYSVQIIPRDTNEISHTDYFLEYEKQ